uniref:Mediator of RNA polymerase II transcription subunit 29 n=1 Tax=Macaca nemestrina TaxID=9545 RepID=A0A2K6CVI7_MACNE
MAASQQQASAASSAAGVSGPSSAGGPGPQQQPQPPAQLVGPAQSGLLQQQQQDFDPVQRYKMLIPQLKESLQVIGLKQRESNVRGAGRGKSSDGPIQRFDKCLEEFYALCDQLELCLPPSPTRCSLTASPTHSTWRSSKPRFPVPRTFTPPCWTVPTRSRARHPPHLLALGWGGREWGRQWLEGGVQRE